MVAAVPEKTLRPVETPATPDPAPVEVVRPLKLSEAMRLGSAVTAQVRGYGNYDTTACALAAAVVGYAGRYDYRVFHDLHDMLGSVRERCPYRGHGLLKGMWPQCSQERPLNTLIIHMNDHHQMPRHEIADWLESKGL